MSKFFINRPIVAMVISHPDGDRRRGHHRRSCPIAQFPAIAPPEVQIRATYVGADAQTIEQSVATPIEQQMSGVDNMNYMYSLNAAANGQMTMIVDFDVKTRSEYRSDPHADARRRRPLRSCRRTSPTYGVTVQKSVTAPLMVIGLYSPHGTYDAQVPGQLRLHQSERSADARARHRQRAGVRRRPIRHAAVGQAGSAGEARHHGAGNRHRRSRRRTR